MTVTVLISGKLFRDPETKTSSRGKPYTTATIRVGQGDDVAWWRVLAFLKEAGDELLSLRGGDGVAVSGTFKAEVYVGSGDPRVNLTVIADRVISAKAQKREKAAVARAGKKAASRVDPGANQLSDAVPW